MPLKEVLKWREFSLPHQTKGTWPFKFRTAKMEMAKFPGQDLFDAVIDLVKEYLSSCQERDSKVLSRPVYGCVT